MHHLPKSGRKHSTSSCSWFWCSGALECWCLFAYRKQEMWLDLKGGGSRRMWRHLLFELIRAYLVLMQGLILDVALRPCSRLKSAQKCIYSTGHHYYIYCFTCQLNLFVTVAPSFKFQNNSSTSIFCISKTSFWQCRRATEAELMRTVDSIYLFFLLMNFSVLPQAFSSGAVYLAV